ncbi:hypothetical protein G7075_17350 [Phycicoccus sp. HDW14]|uniref:hypothetical protein n=1 Tax=Phycicoccus sp. HDW14 TaxID=2714941 RepID=UPI00140B5A40|nr:hypothetical protein [Phycicoccus sp. HDW14]QIM22486.1 hypothetical protein G7075_17350 [Phycicoccus sp. HDW14]
MTTTATRATVRTHAPVLAHPQLRTPQQLRARPALRTRAASRSVAVGRTARLSVLGLLATLALSVPAVALLDGVGPRASSLDVVSTFLIVAVLEVAVARGVWRVTREHAHPAAYAALLARTGYALLLVVGALVLLWTGPSAAPAFRDHWANALGVLGLHLVATGVAFWRSAPSGLAARLGPLALSLSGTTALAATLLPLDGVTLPMVLAPVVVGELLLVLLLARTALGGRTVRPAPAR